MGRSLLGSVGLLLASTAVVWAGPECSADEAGLVAEYMTIVQVHLDGPPGLSLAAGMPAFEHPEGLYVPLGELVQAVEFPIEVRADAGTAEGWFLQKDRRFSLDLSQCEAVVDGDRYPLDGTRAAVRDGDLYIHVDLLERWFPWHLSFDPSRLVLAIDSTEPLPIERNLARERRWRRHDSRGNQGEEGGDYPTAEVPYRWSDWPFADFTIEGRSHWDEAGREQTSDGRYKLVATGDLMKMNAQVAITGTDREAVSDAVATFGRRDPQSRLLGPLGAREYQFGRLGIPRDPLVGENTVGDGVTVSNYPLDRPEEYDNIDFRGELPIGWDAELYRNGQLVAFQSGEQTSRYDFTGIPLQYGLNEYRIVLYGPQGQVRERTVRRLIGPGMVQPGQQHYRVTALEEDEDFAGGPDPTGRYKAEYELGLTDNLSLGAGLQRLELADGVHDYGRFDARAAGPGFFVTIAGAQESDDDPDDGQATYGLLSTDLGFFDLTLETARFRQFESERTLDSSLGLLERRSRVRIDTYGRPTGSWSLAVGGEIGRERWSGGERLDGSLQLSVTGAGWSVTDTIEGRQTELPDVEPVQAAYNSLLLSGRTGDVSLRGRLRHALRPRQQLEEVGLSADWFISRRLTTRLGLNRQVAQDITSVQAGLSRRFESLSLGTALEYADNGNVTARVTLSTGLMRDPSHANWLASAHPRTASGAIVARVFLDENANGQRDPGEGPIPGARVGVRGTGVSGTTDHTGNVVLTDLPIDRQIKLHLGTDSLSDPFLMTQHDGRSLTLRPGRTAEVELAVAPAGSFEGHVYELRGTEPRPATGIRVRLMNLDGQLLEQTQTGYDGYYYFENLPPGYYRVRAETGSGRSSPHDGVIVPFRDGAEFMSSIDLYMGEELDRTAIGDDSSEPILSTTKGNIRTNQWLLEQNPADWTIQIMGATSANTVRGFIRRQNLESRSAYYQTEWWSDPWFPVVYGSYATKDQAQQAMRQLPEALRVAGPWTRSMYDVQREIRGHMGRGK